MNRHDGRARDALRTLELQPDVAPYAEGSCLVIAGNTRVLCTASVSSDLPKWRAASGIGWVTAEYGMLPRATHTRNDRERTGPKGRTQEIQRLIGRSLRAVVDLSALGARSVTLDCDVLQADGGTRTASVTGAWVALHRAGQKLVTDGLVARNPVSDRVAAVSVGVVDGIPVLDLDYREDSSADVDMNVVATGSGKLIEVQGTAEKNPFDRSLLDAMLDLALKGIAEIMEKQRQAVR